MRFACFVLVLPAAICGCATLSGQSQPLPKYNLSPGQIESIKAQVGPRVDGKQALEFKFLNAGLAKGEDGRQYVEVCGQAGRGEKLLGIDLGRDVFGTFETPEATVFQVQWPIHDADLSGKLRRCVGLGLRQSAF